MKTKLVNDNFKTQYTDNLLISRGIKPSDLDYFYNVPDDSALQDPELLDNVREGVALIDTAILNNYKICIIVDSDVDGFTSAAIMYQYLKGVMPGLHIDCILHEGKGHGLSDTYHNIIESDVHYDLIILPDSSTNDREYHDKLKEYGAKCLVLDHHLSESDIYSDNAIIINNQLSKNYANKNLSGAGVTWQFCRALDEHLFDSPAHLANEFIDLAALGIVSDMMSVLELENRYIIHEGFSHIKNHFFRALCDKQSYSMGGKVTPMTVAFYVTPLINAMIRVGTMEEKERCFIAFVDGEEMVESHKRGAKGTFTPRAVESARECTNARSKQNRLLDKVEEELEIKIHKYDLLENRVLFIKLEEEDFPPELNGLVAMRLSARYKRPTIVARVNEEGEVKGSQRGLNESELTSFKDFLDESGFFEFTAGHANASGCGIMENKIPSFLHYANEKLKDIDFGQSYYEVNFERYGADQDIAELITDLTNHEDIYGQHNNEPLIYIKNLNADSSDIRIMGKNQDTVKIEKNGVAYMFFKCSKRIKEFAEHNFMSIEIIGRANMNEWMGNYTPQIFVTDFEISDGSLAF